MQKKAQGDDLLWYSKVSWRNEDALGVAGALLGLELVGAVRRAD